MAPRPKRSAQTAPEPAVEEAEAAGSGRTAGEMHELFAEFVTAETGTPVTAEQVFAITSKRVAFRASDEYLAYRERLDAERDEAAAAKAERAEQRQTAKAEPAEAAPKSGARRGRPAKPALKAVKNEEPEEASAPRPRRGRRAAATATEEVPF